MSDQRWSIPLAGLMGAGLLRQAGKLFEDNLNGQLQQNIRQEHMDRLQKEYEAMRKTAEIDAKKEGAAPVELEQGPDGVYRPKEEPRQLLIPKPPVTHVVEKVDE